MEVGAGLLSTLEFMLIGFPDGVDRHLQEHWWHELIEAEIRYTADPNKHSLAAFKRTLKVFADLVLRGKIPEDYAD